MAEKKIDKSLGLPSKYGVWRDAQWEVVKRIVESDKRFIAVCAPTGFGKTLVYMAAGKLLRGDEKDGSKLVTAVHSRGLQDQLGEFGLTDIRGRGNYECEEKGNCGAEGSCELPRGGEWGECTYQKAKSEAERAPEVSTNYAYLIAKSLQDGNAKVLSPITTGKVVILDEAHLIEGEIYRALEVEIGARDLSVLGIKGTAVKTLEAKVQDGKWGGLEWGEWTVGQKVALKWRLSKGEITVEAADVVLDKLRRIRLAGRNPDNWVITRTQDGRNTWKFQVIWAGLYAGRLLWPNAQKVIFISATLVPKTLALNGVPLDQVEFINCPRVFDYARCPVTHVDSVSHGQGMKSWDRDLWMTMIDQYLHPRFQMGRSGIIIVPSYEQARDIMKGVDPDLRGRLILGESGKTERKVAEYRKRALKGEGVAMISPAIGTGWNFPHDECRFIVVGRIPWPYTQDAAYKERLERDKRYGNYKAIQGVEQWVGRGMREENDWCESVVLDNRMKWLFGSGKDLVAGWFRWDSSRTLPRPLLTA